MSGAQAPGRHGAARLRPRHGRLLPTRSGPGRLGLAMTSGLLLAVLVGCSDSGSSGENMAAQSNTSITASPFPPDQGVPASPTVTPPTVTPPAAAGATDSASAAPDGATAGGGSAGSSGSPDSPDSPGSAGASGPAASGAGAAQSAPGASPAAGAAGGGAAATAVPTPQPSAVFLGEACAPGRNKAPATAVNGLALFCVPDDGGGSAAGGRWSTEPPTSSAQSPPQEGGSCEPADVGQVLRDSAGRPVSCLRDPNGMLSWSDVS
ncbi:hypothetical protein [Candidatus Frankia alpina]|uniref:hypothetical protein n=1 Tax=Candidatus Frankia alpina TaxID=2699483 RepID=UPI0013868173|nr:hypothetical protein [Candidatus Frankia alpina]